MNNESPYQLEEDVLFGRYGIVGYRTDDFDIDTTPVHSIDDSDVLPKCDSAPLT